MGECGFIKRKEKGETAGMNTASNETYIRMGVRVGIKGRGRRRR